MLLIWKFATPRISASSSSLCISNHSRQPYLPSSSPLLSCAQSIPFPLLVSSSLLSPSSLLSFSQTRPPPAAPRRPHPALWAFRSLSVLVVPRISTDNISLLSWSLESRRAVHPRTRTAWRHRRACAPGRRSPGRTGR
ncbi:hypothetical protein BC937DRAFT_94246 [Endogone sp. FLAS-F59071]|nr:hypothetical protein BC937DRAFT_94246 [Endogone sp. FLAS-F59071]|eukprot:RUS22978.1 hypothetical protein BC937DRAFT_94246 [Endogone sp. FLAS-F59071]